VKRDFDVVIVGGAMADQVVLMGHSFGGAVAVGVQGNQLAFILDFIAIEDIAQTCGFTA
jgi:hypothetical protein